MRPVTQNKFIHTCIHTFLMVLSETFIMLPDSLGCLYTQKCPSYISLETCFFSCLIAALRYKPIYVQNCFIGASRDFSPETHRYQRNGSNE